MINLLPPEEKRQLQAARTNTLLVRYNFLMIGAVIFLGLAIGITYFYLTTSKATAEQIITQNQSKVASYSKIAAEADQFRANLLTAKQILDKEVTYTNTILAIAKLLPDGVILQNLSLDSETFGTETTLVAQAKSYERALALKTSFEGSSLFSNVHFASINATENDQTGYPYTVNLNVTIKKEAAVQ